MWAKIWPMHTDAAVPSFIDVDGGTPEKLLN
jgi:hypothetical protein